MLPSLFVFLLSVCAPTASADPTMDQAIARVESSVADPRAREVVRRHGLSLVNVSWEDAGRSRGSAGGSQTSDLTIGVRDSRGELHPLPVIRFDNFADVTADLDPWRMKLRVGNEDGRPLRETSLAAVLRDVRGFLHDPSSWAGTRRSLAAPRDARVLVSAQACLVPTPRAGEATFVPVIWNARSSPGNPAVLTLVATREGTSIQVVENEGGYLSDVLYFNDDGLRAPFTAERASSFASHGGDRVSPGATGEEEGLGVVLVVQVPLRNRPGRPATPGMEVLAEEDDPSQPPPDKRAIRGGSSDLEDAVVGHGIVEGRFEELNGLAVERDPRYPVRVTVQYYKATSNGVLSEADVRQIRRELDRVLAHGDAVGSLVVGPRSGRVTSPDEPVARYDDGGSETWAGPGWGWTR